ncbi:MAG: segregation and condensation protein A [Gammaproteobacteria bacterium]|nr:segregation and condensation protein A [Gammaproteobacteria bacterium]MDH5734724.1 segregation and condensation protein A [Gammaproteobacteria bacterium]
MDQELSKELQILVTMRKVLSSIIRDITPEPGMKHPLSGQTMEDVRQCFALLTAREKELNELAGMPSQHRPQFVDDQNKANVVQFHNMNSTKKDK